jgi:hypothetical protein
MYSTYALSYDPFMTDPAPLRLIEFVRAHSYTYQYFVPYVGTILIKSGYTFQEMVDGYRTFILPNEFILMQVSPQLTGGLLNQTSWDWLNSDNPPALVSKN